MRRPHILGVVLAAPVLAVVILFASSTASDGARKSPIKIGVLSDCEGVWAAFYSYTLAGTELPLIQHGAIAGGGAPAAGVKGAKIAGRPVQLSFGCADGTPASALREARHLVEQIGVQIVIGPLNGNEETRLTGVRETRTTNDVRERIGISSSRGPRPEFLQLSTRMGLSGMQVSAATPTTHSAGEPHRRSRTRATFSTGIRPPPSSPSSARSVGRSSAAFPCPTGATDFSPVAARLPKAHTDGLFFATDPNAVVSLAHAVPFLAGNISSKVLAGITAFGPQITPLESRIIGMIVPDRNGPNFTLAARPYQRALKAAFPRLDPAESGVFDTDYYGAMRGIVKALIADDGELSDGGRRFQHALARVELDLPNGHIRLNSRHQAIGPNYLMRLTRPNLTQERLVRAIPNVEPTFGGYFTAHDPRPSFATPACSRGHVAAWARSG